MVKLWLFLLVLIASALGFLAVASIATSGWKFHCLDLISLDDFGKLKKRLDKICEYVDFLLGQKLKRAEPQCKSKTNLRFLNERQLK